MEISKPVRSQWAIWAAASAQRDAAVTHDLSPSANGRDEALYTEPGQLGPCTDFELGMLSGKLSALRWCLERRGTS